MGQQHVKTLLRNIKEYPACGLCSIDCSVLAHERRLKNVFVSNGYMTPEVTRQLASLLDGINIDIKAFTNDFYKKVCKARLQPVLDNVKLMHELGVWVEVTTLLIPGLNDSPEELCDLARFIKGAGNRP